MKEYAPDDMTASDGWKVRTNVQRIGYDHSFKMFFSAVTIGCLTIVTVVLTWSGIYGSPAPTMGTAILGIVFMVLMWTMVATAHVELYGTWYDIDGQYITNHGVPHHQFSIQWSDISSIYFTPSGLIASAGFVACYGQKKSFRVTRYMEMRKFAYLVRDNVPEERWTTADRLIRNLASDFERENRIAHKVLKEDVEIVQPSH